MDSENSYTPTEPVLLTQAAPKLLDQVRDRIRRKGYSKRTEVSYAHWIKRFILFHGKRHPKDLGAAEVESFLTSLAVELNVAAATQNLALSAILFLYREVLESPLPWLDGIERAKKPARLPTVLTTVEVAAVLARVDGTPGLMLRLLYGTGMRLMECVRLRVKDVDFSMNIKEAGFDLKTQPPFAGSLEGITICHEATGCLLGCAKLVWPDFVQNIEARWRSRAIQWNRVAWTDEAGA